VSELSALHEISQSMHSLNLDEVLHLILQGVTRSIGFDRARLYLINEKEKSLECKMAVGIEQEKIKMVALSLEDGEGSILAKVIAEKKAFIIQDAQNDPRVNSKLKKLFNLRSFVAVPLRGRERVMGAITADYIVFSDKVITKEKVDSLITFANQAGLAIENATLYQELRRFNEELEERVRKATEDLKKTQEQLIQSSRLSALGQLSAGVAHEIRNPLTSIRILIHSLMERLSPDDIRRDDIEVIENEIERINQITKQFLDFARPSKPKMERVDINRAIADTLLLLSHELMEQYVNIEQNFSPLPSILADKEQMRQIFLNLILNATQAMPGGGRLRISTAHVVGVPNAEVAGWPQQIPATAGRCVSTDVEAASNAQEASNAQAAYNAQEAYTMEGAAPSAPVAQAASTLETFSIHVQAAFTLETSSIRLKNSDSQVKISFQDEGSGIPESIIGKLFEPFFTTKEEGIGLGLPITKRIVEDHRGKIEVESTEGKGSIFSVILPVA
jgi:signal transduction histidine kinase